MSYRPYHSDGSRSMIMTIGSTPVLLQAGATALVGRSTLRIAPKSSVKGMVWSPLTTNIARDGTYVEPEDTHTLHPIGDIYGASEGQPIEVLIAES